MAKRNKIKTSKNNGFNEKKSKSIEPEHEIREILEAAERKLMASTEQPPKPDQGNKALTPKQMEKIQGSSHQQQHPMIGKVLNFGSPYPSELLLSWKTATDTEKVLQELAATTAKSTNSAKNNEQVKATEAGPALELAKPMQIAKSVGTTMETKTSVVKPTEAVIGDSDFNTQNPIPVNESEAADPIAVSEAMKHESKHDTVQNAGHTANPGVKQEAKEIKLEVKQETKQIPKQPIEQQNNKLDTKHKAKQEIPDIIFNTENVPLAKRDTTNGEKQETSDEPSNSTVDISGEHQEEMPNEKPEEKFLTIKQVATILQVELSTIRFWEKEFAEYLGHALVRNQRKCFTERQLEIFTKIKELLKTEQYTIDGAKRRLELDHILSSSLGVEHNFKTTVFIMLSAIMQELQASRQESKELSQQLAQLQVEKDQVEEQLQEEQKKGFLDFIKTKLNKKGGMGKEA